MQQGVPAVRQLRLHVNPSLEERHQRELLVQRVRALPQDERDASSLVKVDLAEELLVQLEQVPTGRNCVRQLCNDNNHVVAKNQGERDRVQRLWTLLQGPRQGPTHPAEEGRRPDEEEEVDEEGGDDEEHLHHQLQLHHPLLLLSLPHLLQLQLGGLPTMPVLH